MVTNGLKLKASPLLPIGSQTWPHRARIGTDGYAGLASLCKDMKAVGIESIELVSPSGEFSALTDGKQVRKSLDDSVDWVKVFQAAKKGSLQNYFIEQSWDLTLKSLEYLKTLNVS